MKTNEPIRASFRQAFGATIEASLPGQADTQAGRSSSHAAEGPILSQGVAAWLRHAGARAEYLEGGFDAWVEAKGLLVSPSHLPTRDDQGRTVWVTRTRPKIDRIACPWLIRRFVDPAAAFLFVAPSEVVSVAEQFGAAPFDVEGVFWSHRRGVLHVRRHAGRIWSALWRSRSAGRGHPSGGYRPARSGRKPLAFLPLQLAFHACFAATWRSWTRRASLYDAFYRWARDATGETHTWPTPSGGRA